MFLKSLTLQGFKSFSDKTRLTFEPGITVIVGPNGSGKSNIVDALAWVLGSLSPKSLRGGSMSDVIFAGSPGKPALGRAAAEITIDNSAGILPIEFSEVRISRSMFATGENTYAINGVECRLLDVQELLSDTGLGREHHTIVGQGQLDQILNAKPQERRVLIDEAAGILKHRRRKERSLRKLAQMEGHLARLRDVLRELRRNLRPLERQAEAASKHAELQEALADVRTVRALRQLRALTRRIESEQADRASADAMLAEANAALQQAREREADLERLLADLAPVAQSAGETHFRLAGLTERLRGLRDRIEERRRGLVEAVEEPVAARDPALLRAEAAQQQDELDLLSAAVEAAGEELAEAAGRRRAAEQARRAHEQAAAAEARRRSEARERRLRWEGQVAALRSALAQAASEEGRLASQVSGVTARRSQLDTDIAAARAEIQRLDAQDAVLTDQLAAAEASVERRQRTAEAAALRERELERQRASLEARIDALRAASAEADEGTQALLEAAGRGEIDGIIGPLADHVAVTDGLGKALGAALGPLGDALIVTSRATAVAAVDFIRGQRSGRALLFAAEDPSASPLQPSTTDAELAPLGARPLWSALRAAPPVLAALRRALWGVYVTADFDAASRLAERYPDAMFVTRDGEVAGPRGYAGGSAGATSVLLARAGADQAASQLEQVADELLRAHRQLADADRELAAARREQDAATAAMQESDALITAAAERLKRLRNELDTCEVERQSLQRQQQDLAREMEAQRHRLEQLERQGPDGHGDTDVVADPEAEGPDPELERLDDILADAREAEVQARLALSTAEQRRDELARRVTALREEADTVERQLADREERRRQRLAAIDRCDELSDVVALALTQAEESHARAAAERGELEQTRSAQERELGALRAQLRELESQVAALREERHAEDLAQQELQHELDEVAARLVELDVDPATALEQAEPETFSGGEERDQALVEEEERLVRKLGLLGTVNPLALEELQQLEERHAFLTEQLEDLKSSRRDLLQVVEAIDDKIREVFATAFADVAAQFEAMFPRLFPGGEGRLVLTDSDDLLETGVEVEARPPGKRVKRLSLLSGGERSLTALAVLFAIFAARPSPFYVLDEVEAALDDVNLQRFLEVVRDFRSDSQLLIVTHQKRTMEVADCLYGISMRGDGVSKVISQRLTETAAVS